MRTFIAIELPEGVRAALESAVEPLQSRPEGEYVRWSRSESIHLTLKFLGEIGEGRVQPIAAVLDSVAAHAAPLQLDIGGFGCFPNKKKPRVLWIGISTKGNCLIDMQAELETQLAAFGFAREQRRYHPHLTIGRARKGLNREELSALSRWVDGVSLGSITEFEATSIRLMRSDLKPTGAIYSNLHRADLQR